MRKFKEDNKECSWHYKNSEAVLKELDATPTGLSNQEANSRIGTYGYNTLPKTHKTSSIMRFLKQFHSLIIYVLIVTAIITFALNHLIDTFVILAVIIANAIIGFIQEVKAEKAIDAIAKILSPHTSVLRDGKRFSVDSRTIVPGDIILLEPGDKVTADLRLISVQGLFVQESVLTGESVPVEKNINTVAESAMLGDRSCMAYTGTLVTSGQGKGVVIAIGIDTEIGLISESIANVETLTTPLVKQIGVFAKWLTLFILLGATILFIYGYYFGNYLFVDIFMIVVGLSVAAIPEGLPAVLTITLAIGVQAMARRNVIVRKLYAIETLGAVSVICTDKTGTLTRNDMMVNSVLTDQHMFYLDGVGYEPKGIVTLADKAIDPSEYVILKQLAIAAVYCNNARLSKCDDSWIVDGDPMEGALLSFAGKIELDLQSEELDWPLIDSIPFDAKNRFMATLHRQHDQQSIIFVKGAPEKILAMCHKQLSGTGGTEDIDLDYWLKKTDVMAGLGQRVLAFGFKIVKSTPNKLHVLDIKHSITFIGVVGMIDPVRSEAIVAVAACRAAGIRVKMITGDHSKTACVIGKEIGLQNYTTVLTGGELDCMNDAEFMQVVLQCDIFARTSPNNKLRLVMALQSHGLTVAMTGDGVNDSPALKRADVGIAMGVNGNDAAKEAAEIVLLDDNFNSILSAIREGRTAHDNIKKVISWTLPTNAGETLVIMVAILFGMTLPITPVQILWINLITTITLGISLAFEPTEEHTMLRRPRPRNKPLLSNELLWHIALVAILFVFGGLGVYKYAIDSGYSIELVHTITLNTIVVMEIFHLLFIRNIYSTSLTWKGLRGTKIVWSTISIVIASQLVITYLPVFQSIFSTQSVPFLDMLLIVGVGIMFFIAVETEKQIRYRLQKRVM